MDSGVGDDPKSSTTYKRQRRRLRTGRLSLLRVEAQETELPKKPALRAFLQEKNFSQIAFFIIKTSGRFDREVYSRPIQ